MPSWMTFLTLAIALLGEPVFAQQEPIPDNSASETLLVLPDSMEPVATAETVDATTQDEAVEQVLFESSCATGGRHGSAQSYVNAEYLFWGLPSVDLPRLLTSNPTGTPLGLIADASDPSTQTLLGDSEVGDWAHSGMRLRFGHVVEHRRLSRWEISGWFLFEESDDVRFGSIAGDPILARPFINAASGLPDAQVLSLAGFADGSLRSQYDRSLLGVEPLVFFCVSGDGCNSLEAFTGYRYLHYEDELRLTETVQPAAGGLIAPGTEFLVEDTFSATNDYHLIPLGLHFARRHGDWRLSARGSVSLGFVSQEVNIRGRTTTSVGGVVDSVEAGGLLALASNSGSHDQTKFAVVPELNLQLHRALGDGKWFHVGYTLMYLNDVVRGPSHIDTTIDPNQLPPAIGTGTRPAFAFVSDDELLHGLNAGFEWHY